MALPERVRRQSPKGHERPRIAPPIPARSRVGDYEAQAKELGIDLFPWQRTAARYLTALGRGETWLYREVAIVVARQNGKTRLLVPLIVQRLRAGQRIMHTAQDRALPREVFEEVVDLMLEHYPDELKGKPRLANGQESIKTKVGGRYRIVAPTHGGARGPTNDTVLYDELREADDYDFVGAAEPTMTASPCPQLIYLSNAGTATSVVLNGLRTRSTNDPSLAYLEWSSAPDRAPDDIVGWQESNPSIGYLPAVLPTLEKAYLSSRLEPGKQPLFETEHLCRWVTTMREPLIDEFLWRSSETQELAPMRRPFMAVSMDPDGRRASVAFAYRQPDESIALTMWDEVVGDPIDTDALGRDLRKEALRRGVVMVGFDPMTDKALARSFPKQKVKPVSGQEYVNASARFVTAIEAGRVKWNGAEAVTDDLPFTARKAKDAPGTFEAVRADDDRPITAALAAIRAVWLASEIKMSLPTGF